MHPILFRWGDAALQTYALLVSVAYFVGLGVWIGLGRARRFKIENQINLSLLTVAAAWVGARALFVATQWQRFFVDGDFHLLAPWEGGVVFLGGMVAASVLLWFALPKFGISRWEGFDTLAPALCFAHAIGRIGCFANGCCFGDHCDLPWAVRYSDPLSAAPLGIDLHPSQLYESIALIALGALLVWHERRPKPLRWHTVQLYFVGYGLARFGLEFTRGDTMRGAFGGLSTSQWISIALVLSALLLDFTSRIDKNSEHESSGREPHRSPKKTHD